MVRIGRIFPAFVVAALTGCGTYVPNLQEFAGDAGSGPLLVRAIVESVHCELRRSLVDVIDQDKRLAKLNGVRTAPWLDDWGVQIGLTLQVDETTAVNPTISVLPPSFGSKNFTLGGGASISTTATRADVLNYYYKVKDLYRLGKCAGQGKMVAGGSFLIRNDLKIGDWLSSQVLAAGTDAITVPTSISTPLQQNAISHEVKFEVKTGGDITPSWTLKEADINQDGAFLSASRNRTHDLVLTFGPVDPSTTGLVGAAAGTFYALQIGAAVSRGETK